MSPTIRDGAEARGAKPAVVIDGQNTTFDHQLEEKSAVPENAALEKMLAMLGDLSERMCRMESSQSRQVGRHRIGTFDSPLSGREGMDLRALEHTPSLKRSPNVSPVTYFGARRPVFAGNMVGPPAQGHDNHGGIPAPMPEVANMPAGMFPGMGGQAPMFYPQNQVHMGVPDGRQRNLALQPFDDEELAQFAQATEVDVRVKHFGREALNVVEPGKAASIVVTDTRRKEDHGSKKCYLCGATGHLKANCTKKTKTVDFVLTVQDVDDQTEAVSNWVLESGSGLHLVNDLSLLEDVTDCSHECFTAASDGKPLRITK
ncbi:hypothetical protein PsorP6_011475 [Peronosclerospora sorghi]|uniref:Uncharacterized protein n=1 Tax=Peronosclerospora sorghi TaxID=230839 RepID=A0ACC0WHS6_9STRA|nr:hypothetical protein PsorP6_011475 [Peronosclerospora sorghi]